MFLMGLALASVAFPVQSQASDLDLLARKAADAAIAKYGAKGLKAEELGITVAVLDRSRGTLAQGSYRGDQPMYPASVVKMFYLAYAAHQLQEKKLILTPEFERGIHDMIVDSNNDATGLVLDTITGTTGGPELPPRQLSAWMEKRQAANRWYAGLGYPKLNASQKTWNEGPYGRERQGYGPKFELRNQLSPDACVRLMSDIALRKIVTPEKCEWMEKYLGRAIPADAKETDEQARNFSGKILPSGTKLWSKAGWTDEVRHDVAHVRMPDGKEFVYAIFTKGHSGETDLIADIATSLLKGLGE